MEKQLQEIGSKVLTHVQMKAKEVLENALLVLNKDVHAAITAFAAEIMKINKENEEKALEDVTQGRA